MGKQYPLSAEKLSPVLSLHFVSDFDAAMDTCFALLKFGGLGHTAVIYAKNDARIREYGLRMPAMRVLVNTPAPQGSTGITTNVFPVDDAGLRRGWPATSPRDNVGPQHLINIKRLAYVVRKPEEAFEMPLDINKAPYARSPPPAGSRHRSRHGGRGGGTIPGIARHRGSGRRRSGPSVPRAVVQLLRRAAQARGPECRGRRGGSLPGSPRRIRLAGRL